MSERAEIKKGIDQEVTEQHTSRVKKIEARNAALTKPTSFRIGQLVLVRNSSVKQEAYRKLALEWGSQPFRVIGKPSMYNVLVMPVRGGDAKTVNLQDVKEYKPQWRGPGYVAPKQKNIPTSQSTPPNTQNGKSKTSEQVYVQVQTLFPTPPQSPKNMQSPPESQPTPIAQQTSTTELQENARGHNRLEPATPAENSNRYDLATPMQNVTHSTRPATVSSKEISQSSTVPIPAPKPAAVQKSSSSTTSKEVPAQVSESTSRATAPAKVSQQVTTAYGRVIKPTEKALGPK
jgi:hypothetical protein